MSEQSNLDRIHKAQQSWEQETAVHGQERRAGFKTISQEPVARLYTPTDHITSDYLQDQGFPGGYPYTRGIHATMYRGRLWTMRQFSGFGTAADSNQRFKFLLEHGQTGLSVAFDVPTLMGLDSDHPLSDGEVGMCGVAIDSLADMEVLFSEIPLGSVSTSMTINAPAAIIFAMYLAVAEKQGVAWGALRGTIQNDILKEYIAQKEWIIPPRPALKLVADTVAFCTEYVPQWNPISISGYHIREAGSTALQELAFTLADGFAYIDTCLDAGLQVDQFAPRLSFFFNAHMDFFEEIAKYRAARRIWARHLRERYGARDERSWLLRFHTQTAGCSLTAQQPENNIIRTTVEALAAVLGGTQSLHTNAFDEAYALPSEYAAKVALRTQQVIAHETGVTHTVDPLGGSYFIEALTDRLEAGAEEYFQKIHDFGGMVQAIEIGYPQREIIDASKRFQETIEQDEQIIVGVNEYIEPDDSGIEALRIDPEVEEVQKTSLRNLKTRRNGQEVVRTLDALRTAVHMNDNTMPTILDAVRAYATVGEIVSVLQEVYGVYEEPPVF